MSWEEAIREICVQLESEASIREVLEMAMDEGMLTVHQAEAIATMVHITL